MKKTTNWSLWLIVGVIAIVRLNQIAVYYAQNQFVGVAEAKDASLGTPPQSLLRGVSNPNFDDTEKIKRNMAEITKNYVYLTALASGVDTELALWIIKKESAGNYLAVGDNGDSIGLWQFNLRLNKDIKYSCAIDVRCSTELAMKWLLEGKKNRWSVVSYCKEWFSETCPF